MAVAGAADRAPKQSDGLIRVTAALPGVAALKTDEVTAKLNGAPAAVRDVKGPEDDLLLLLVFDIAGDLSLVEVAKQSLIERLRELPANHYVSVIRANEGMQVMLDPTGDRDAVASSVSAVPVSGKAAMLDTVETAVRLADSVGRRSGVRAAVLYVTDSDVANYREDFTNPVINYSDSRDLSRRFPEGLIREKISRVQDALGALQAPVYFVHLAFRPDRLNDAYQTGLLALAAATGGHGVFCRSMTEISEAVRSVVDRAANHYVISLQAPPKAPRNSLVELSSERGGLLYRTRFQVR